MPNYIVNISRTATQTTELTVKASSVEEAQSLALDAAHDMDFSGKTVSAEYDIEGVREDGEGQ